MKIDIVDLLDFYCNDVPVPDAPEELEELAKQGRTRLTRRKTGRRRKGLLLAAEIMLLMVLTAMPFVLSRTTDRPDAASKENVQPAEASDDGQTAYPTDGPADAENAENSQSAEAPDDEQTAHPTGTLLSSAVYPVVLEVPEEYAAEIEVDTPFLDDTLFFEEIRYDNAVFSFYDKSCREHGLSGLVWCITATPKNEYMPLDPKYYGVIFDYNEAELGTDEDYAYTLIYPSALRQYIQKDSENAESYFAHLAIGKDLVTQFIRQNSLQSDGAGVERYAEYLAFLGGRTAPSAGMQLSSAVYPVVLEVPEEYAAEIEVDTPFLDTWLEYLLFDNVVFSFCDKTSNKYDLIGLVWFITATPKNEYTPLAPAEYDYIYEYNEVELGRDEDYVYTLFYPSASRQCNSNDPENAESYLAHIVVGQDMLIQFIQQNSLQSDGTGIERYAAFLAIQKKWEKF